MRVRHSQHGTRLWLSADDTYRWAHRTGATWPASTLSGHRVMVDLDGNGDLVDLTVDGGRSRGYDVDGNELNAIIEDSIGSAHLRGDEPVRQGRYRLGVGSFLLGRVSSREARRQGQR